MLLQLPKYKCHKIVGAATILHTDEEYIHIDLENGNVGAIAKASVNVPQGIEDLAGMKLVQYENNYFSVSPIDVFDKGYSRFDVTTIVKAVMHKTFSRISIRPNLSDEDFMKEYTATVQEDIANNEDLQFLKLTGLNHTVRDGLLVSTVMFDGHSPIDITYTPHRDPAVSGRACSIAINVDRLTEKIFEDVVEQLNAKA